MSKTVKSASQKKPKNKRCPSASSNRSKIYSKKKRHSLFINAASQLQKLAKELLREQSSIHFGRKTRFFRSLSESKKYF